MREYVNPSGRPVVVAWLEWIGLGVLAAAFLVDRADAFSAVIHIVQLWILISVTRGRSRVAQWVLTVSLGLGFALGAWGLAAGAIEFADVTIIAWAFSVADIVLLWLLWSRGMSRWIASRRKSAAELRV